jgi:hypothetical protein
VACVLAIFVSGNGAAAFDSYPTNFADRLESWNVAALGKLVSTTDRKTGGVDQQSVFEVVDIARQPAHEFSPGQMLTVPSAVTGNAGDLFLLLGDVGAKVTWSRPTAMTEKAFVYIRKTPSPWDDSSSIPYYIEHLESPDKLIATDVFEVLSRIPPADLTRFRDRISRDAVRRWVESPETPPNRLSLYGLLLGLTGTPDDRDYLEKRILTPTGEFRAGLDGLMLGYLLLAGEDGLRKLEDAKFRDPKAVFSETYGAMQAILQMWKSGDDTISKPRLCKSMRLLLGRPELADLAVSNLTRFQDWQAMEQVVALYDAPADNNAKATKRAVVRYLHKLTEQLAESTEPGQVDLRTRATAFLAEKKKSDPETYERVMKFQLLVKPVPMKPKATP